MSPSAPLPTHRLAGAVLALGAVGFMVVFSILAARLGYPDVLDRPPAEVLPALVSGGNSLRIVWAVYALLPMALVIVALRTHGTLGLSAGWQRLTTTGGVLAGFAMSAGLVRWPTLQWTLANAHAATTDASVRATLEVISDALNVTLGNVVGEFTGELGMTLFFLGIGWSMRSRWAGRASVLLAVLLAIGSVRNVTHLVQWATEITNLLLPVVMVWVGGAWLLRGLRVPRAAPVVVAALCVLFAGSEARAEGAPTREVIVHGFRAPSMGIEIKENWLGFHLGAYPTTIDVDASGSPRTTWFLKTGLMAYPLQFDTGSGRLSSPYVGLSLVQGLNNAWDVSRSTNGAGVLGEVGFRWAVFSGLDLRLGVAVLVGFDGRVQVNPTPGISWAVPL